MESSEFSSQLWSVKYINMTIEDFVNECNLISENTNDEQTDEDLFNNINSKYYCIQDFNKINTNTSSSIGICHTNIASLSEHIVSPHIVSP